MTENSLGEHSLSMWKHKNKPTMFCSVRTFNGVACQDDAFLRRRFLLLWQYLQLIHTKAQKYNFIFFAVISHWWFIH